MIDNSRLIVAVVLSVAIMMGFHFFYERPRMEQVQAQMAQQKAAALEQALKPKPVTETLRDRNAIIADSRSERIVIDTPTLHGSINLRGARIDDLTLGGYRETVDPASAEIVLLSPAGTQRPQHAYYAAFGWLAEKSGLALPDGDTLWQADRRSLTPTTPVTLRWNNGAGLTFERVIALDEHYLFTITDRIKNSGGQELSLHPYGLVLRHGEPVSTELAIMHTGPMGVFDGTLQEHSYSKMISEGTMAQDSKGGWIGITDKYWLVALLPPQDQTITAQFKYSRLNNEAEADGRFQTDFRGPAITLTAGGNAEYVTHLFAGAKELHVLDQYEEKLGVLRLDRAIDFGWFYFLTKPFLYLLNWLTGLIGNAGLALLVLTVIVKAAVLPLGIKSYYSMAKLKKLQPDMQRLMERFKDDRTRQSMEVMELYKREKANPLSGCLPILLQIPVFFALYKVLYVGIEMRHAPFFGWIKDLSAPDPTTFINLFGLLPFDAPGFLSFMHIGIWPLLMGASMFLQQRMSPQPADPVQAKVFLFLPIIFTFMLGPTMASGLIIYWTWSNLISISQQYFIYKRLGVKLT